MICNKCGNEVKDGEKFCSKCGKKVKNNSQRKKGSKLIYILIPIVSIIIVIVGIVLVVVNNKEIMDNENMTYSNSILDNEKSEDNVDNIENKEIHVTSKIQSNYIHVLFYTQYNTKDFIETVRYEDTRAEFKNVLSFGKYYFEDIKDLEKTKVYVIKKEVTALRNVVLLLLLFLYMLEHASHHIFQTYAS